MKKTLSVLLLSIFVLQTYQTANADPQITIDESAGQTDPPITVKDNSGNVLFRILSDGQAIIDQFIQFSGSGLTSLRTYIFPDSSGTVVLEDTSQTLTSKTIDADSNVISNIEDADIKSGANIAISKLETDPRARSSHTGTQTASTISDFDTQVQLSRLDQMASPTSDVSINNNKITNLADPTFPADAATKFYADSIAQGLDIKQSVRVATTTAGTLASDFEDGDTVDGVGLATGDRILIKDQAAGEENGIYTVNLSGAPTRSTDADTSAEVNSGMFCFVREGTTNADVGFVLVTDNPILGTDALVFTQFTGLATGEINTASNTLADDSTQFGLAKAKSGVDLPFRVLKEGANIDLTDDADKVTIAVTGAELTANKDVASGYAGLDGSARIDKNQAPSDTVYTDDVQTLTLKTIDADSNTITNIDDNEIKSSAGIDVTKLSSGLVDNTEFNTLDGVTSAIQTQINTKESTANKNAASGYAGLEPSGRIAKSIQHSATVYTDDAQALTLKTIDADFNTITNIDDNEIKSNAGIDKSKISSSGTWTAAEIPSLDTSKITTGTFGTTFFTNNAINNTKLSDMATQTFKGRTTAATGDPEDLTVTQATAMLNVFTSGLKGIVPASGGGTTNFLRADGTFAAPPGSGGPTVLGADVTCTLTAAYCTAFTIPLTANSGNFVDVNIIGESSIGGGPPGAALQFRGRVDQAGTTGFCTITHYTTATAQALDTLAVGTAPIDDGETAWFPAANTPQPMKMICGVKTGATPGSLFIEWQQEVASTGTVKSGSYYIKTP